MASNLLLTSLTFLSFLHSALAAAAATASAAQPTTGTSSSSFPSITDTENSGVFSASDSGNTSGASGPERGAFKLSTGAIVGLAIALGIIVTAFIVLWALWFTAKRRNWAVRDTIVYASRRLTGRRTVPPTPRTPAPGTPWATSRNANRYRSDSASDDDIERAPVKPGPHRGNKTPAKSSMKPHPGWLTQEKEPSRSTTSEHAPARR